MKRRQLLLLLISASILGIGGCSWWNGLTMRSQSPEKELLGPDDSTSAARLVGDLAAQFGTHPIRIDAVGLVTGLRGTGSDPGPTPQRAKLMEEMQARNVNNPNAVLASGDVSLVMVQGWLRPGIQKGDHFDIELRVLSQSETTSLRGGYLLDTRLQESAVLSNQLRHGRLLAMAKGPVLIDPSSKDKQDRVAMCRGRVLGGGVVLESRKLGLALLPEHKGVLNSSRVATAVNGRFHSYEKGVQIGVAKAKTAEFIELTVHPRYKDNIDRYMKVVLSLVLKESSQERLERIVSLEAQLLDPETSADAALQLEAIGGKDAINSLCKAIPSKNTEVRFYAAESLAYLDRREAAEPLGQIARDEPAFRVFALTALSTMQDFAAYEQLRDLLSVPSAETRYGAFRALWTMNPKDALVKGSVLGEEFHYHVLDVGGPDMVHVTRNRLSELVLFGREQRFSTPLVVNAGNEIMVTSTGGDEISVSKYTVHDGDQKRIVSTRIDDVIRAIVELGGTYPDVVQTLQEAQTAGALASRFEVDALPAPGRSYDRVADEDNGDADATEERVVKPASPLPELFSAKEQESRGDKDASPDRSDTSDRGTSDDDSDEDSPPKKGFFARMLGR